MKFLTGSKNVQSDSAEASNFAPSSIECQHQPSDLLGSINYRTDQPQRETPNKAPSNKPEDERQARRTFNLGSEPSSGAFANAVMKIVT
jgi:hypothetical protein